eukprot:8611070-Pyramimonas_sp.AAC.1
MARNFTARFASCAQHWIADCSEEVTNDRGLHGAIGLFQHPVYMGPTKYADDLGGADSQSELRRCAPAGRAGTEGGRDAERAPP